MADAKRCDRCDKFYTPLKLDTKNSYPDGRPIIKIEIHTFGMFDYIDLCPDCGMELRKFIGMERTKL